METPPRLARIFIIWLPGSQFPICFRPLVEDIVGDVSPVENFQVMEALGRGRFHGYFDLGFCQALAELRGVETVPTHWIEPYPGYHMLSPHGGKIGEVLTDNEHRINVTLLVTTHSWPNRLRIEELDIDLEIPDSIATFPELGDYLASRHRGAISWKLGNIAWRTIGRIFGAPNIRLGLNR